MYFEYRNLKLNSFLRLTDNVDLISQDCKLSSGLFHILWNRSKETAHITVEAIPVSLEPNQLFPLTYLQKTEFVKNPSALYIFSFNREFYCIKDHDHEVSCNGLLFFGTKDIPILTLDSENQKRLDLLFKVFEEEFDEKDSIQGEMLQMLLKRLIILCTRMARGQLEAKSIGKDQVDIIRAYYVLVDKHFKEKKTVAEYAELLFKAPKTLSNLFKKFNDKSPLHVIHERILLEARRLLTLTDKTVKEISFDLGFNDDAAFTKFFKKLEGRSPINYRKSEFGKN